MHHTELAEGLRGEKIVWIVRRMEIDFLKPARMDDVLTIDTRTEKISGARIFMAQEIRRGDDVLIAAKVEAAIIGENGRPKRFPERVDRGFHAGQRLGRRDSNRFADRYARADTDTAGPEPPRLDDRRRSG